MNKKPLKLSLSSIQLGHLQQLNKIVVNVDVPSVILYHDGKKSKELKTTKQLDNYVKKLLHLPVETKKLHFNVPKLQNPNE